MNSYKRMNDSATRETLITSARSLFARNGFRGTTIRAVTSKAGTNLGAVTYHFGSKRELYHAVLSDATSPIRKRVEGLRAGPGQALDKIEVTIRSLFDYIQQNPDLPRLFLHVLASNEPLPPPARLTMKTIIGHLTQLIDAGQQDGSVRSGISQMLALTSGSQPIFFGIYRRALEEAVGLDQSDEETSRQLTETAIEFVRSGLTPPPAANPRAAERR